MKPELIADKLIAQSAAFVQASREVLNPPQADFTQPITRRYPHALKCATCGDVFGNHFGLNCAINLGAFEPAIDAL